jgi:4-hydroxybenzoate polyprenyltransferase
MIHTHHTFIKTELKRLARVCRVFNPFGTFVLFFPGLWGYLSLPQRPPIVFVVLIFAVAFWTRSIGCFINDYTDRNIDGHITRTRSRPLVSTPPSMTMWAAMAAFGAIPFLFVYVFYSTALVTLATMGALGMIIYPWCKRWTFYPQVFLALSFNLIVFFTPVFFRLPLTPLTWVMYGWSVLWTIFYDTIYAFQDVADDRAHGVKSTAVLWHAPKARHVLNTLFFMRYALTAWIAPTVMAWCILGLIGTYHWSIWQKTNVSDPSSCAHYLSTTPTEGLCIALWMAFFF